MGDCQKCLPIIRNAYPSDTSYGTIKAICPETVKMLLSLLMKLGDDDHDVNSDFVDGDGDDGNVVGDGDFVHVSSAPRNPL